VPCDTVVQLYIVVLLGTLWFHFCIVCGTIFIYLCTVVPFVTLWDVMCAQWCRLLHWGLLCRLYVKRTHGAVWEQADWSIVVPCVTLWLVMFAQWCRLLHWGLYWTLRCYGGILKIATLINLYVPLQKGHCWFVKLHHEDWLTLVLDVGDCWYLWCSGISWLEVVQAPCILLQGSRSLLPSWGCPAVLQFEVPTPCEFQNPVFDEVLQTCEWWLGNCTLSYQFLA